MRFNIRNIRVIFGKSNCMLPSFLVKGTFPSTSSDGSGQSVISYMYHSSWCKIDKKRAYRGFFSNLEQIWNDSNL